MINKSCVDRHGKAILERLPSWLLYVLGIYTVTLIVHSLTGYGEVLFTATSGYAWSTAVCFNITLVAVGSFSILRTWIRFWDTWSESKRFVDRIWNIAKHVELSEWRRADLGKADRNGVYTRRTRTGAKLYLRMARGSMSNDLEPRIWQWSLDRRIWTSTAKVDQYWNEHHSISGPAEKILLRRLEVESAFREKQPNLHSSAIPPAIELNLAQKEEKQRLTASVPRGFLCPISMEIMTQPVVTPSGITYDRHSLTNWIEQHHSDPATHAPLRIDHLYPNLALRDMIQEWLVEHRFIGTDR